jgi:hypothetical protein
LGKIGFAGIALSTFFLIEVVEEPVTVTYAPKLLVFMSTVPLRENPPNPLGSLRLDRSVSVDSPSGLFFIGLRGLLSLSICDGGDLSISPNLMILSYPSLLSSSSA